MKKHHLVSTAVWAFATIFGAQARADTIPSAFYFAQLGLWGESSSDESHYLELESDTPGGLTDSDNDPRSYSWLPQPVPSSLAGTVNVSGTPTPNVTFSASLQYSGWVGLQGSVQYWFEVNGPAGSVGVRLDGATGVTIPDVENAAYFNGGSTIQVTDSSGNNVYFWYDVAGDNPNTGTYVPSFSDVINQTLNLQANTLYSINIMTGVTLRYWPSTVSDLYPDVATATGYFDPTLTVVGPNPDLYSLAFSPGIGNGLATPEPSTWAMMALGFLGLSWIGARRGSTRPVRA